jgi:hypothetical protein
MRSNEVGWMSQRRGNALWPSQIKAPMGQGQFGPHRLQTSSSHPRLLIRFCRFREMSPLSRQSTIFLQSKLTEELNSELFWIDGAVPSAFHEETIRMFEGAATPLEGSPAPPPSISCRCPTTITSALLPLPPEMLNASTSDFECVAHALR